MCSTLPSGRTPQLKDCAAQVETLHESVKSSTAQVETPRVRLKYLGRGFLALIFMIGTLAGLAGGVLALLAVAVHVDAHQFVKSPAFFGSLSGGDRLTDRLGSLLPEAWVRFEEFRDLLEEYAAGEHSYQAFAGRAARRVRGEPEDWGQRRALTPPMAICM